MAGVDPADTAENLDQAAADLGPFVLPVDADQLDQAQRDLILRIIHLLVK